MFFLIRKGFGYGNGYVRERCGYFFFKVYLDSIEVLGKDKRRKVREIFDDFINVKIL